MNWELFDRIINSRYYISLEGPNAYWAAMERIQYGKDKTNVKDETNDEINEDENKKIDVPEGRLNENKDKS